MARVASSGVEKQTNPNPFERPVLRSFMTRAEVMVPMLVAIDETSNVRSRDEEEMAIITKFNNLSKNKSDKVHTIQKLKVDVDADEWVPT